MKLDGNSDCLDKWLEFLDLVLNYNFGGSFRIVFNKEIKFLEYNVKKSKMFFKDIEEQYFIRLVCIDIVNIFLLVNQKKLSEFYIFDLKLVIIVFIQFYN